MQPLCQYLVVYEYCLSTCCLLAQLLENLGQFPTVITLQLHCPNGLLREIMSIYIYNGTYVMLAKQLTIASRCPPIPLSIGHAGSTVVSLQGVPLATGVGHCGFKGCTRATSLTICRSIRGWTTGGACREGTGTVFPVATMASTCNSMQTKGHASIHMHNHASKSTYLLYMYKTTHMQMHVYIYMNHTHQHRYGAHEYMYLYVHTY